MASHFKTDSSSWNQNRGAFEAAQRGPELDGPGAVTVRCDRHHAGLPVVWKASSAMGRAGHSLIGQSRRTHLT